MKNILIVLLMLSSVVAINAQTKTANVDNTDEVLKWAQDGQTKKIVFPAGIYNFEQAIVLKNNDLILEGSGTKHTILKRTAGAGSFFDAIGNNAQLSNMTIDANQQRQLRSIFLFNKSKGHHFENVTFKNASGAGITATSAWATDGLQAINCVFSKVGIPIYILNRNTNKRGGEVVTNVDKIVIDNCVFESGYMVAISSDNGNDRRDDGNGTGPRYTQSISLSGTEIKNCTFGKANRFQIAMVQTKDVIIENNVFEGMTDGERAGQALHFEQFSQNFEIYDNVFNMPNTINKPTTYIHFQGTEGHKRVTQERPSNTYKTWTYKIAGSRERRASPKCSNKGHISTDCKRDVHAYGARNIYVAGNTFNASTKISACFTVNEGENIQIGTKKDGTVALNQFLGGDANTKKIYLGGHDEGTGDVLILAGQNIVKSNVVIPDVSYDLPALRLKKPIIVE